VATRIMPAVPQGEQVHCLSFSSAGTIGQPKRPQRSVAPSGVPFSAAEERDGRFASAETAGRAVCGMWRSTGCILLGGYGKP
jgi:hypothetical protein